MWRLNPEARAALSGMGRWAVVLLTGVCIACSLAAVGLWKGTRWGLHIAMAVLTVNVVGDLGNALVRGDLRTLIGIPIAGAMIVYLLRCRRNRYFAIKA